MGLYWEHNGDKIYHGDSLKITPSFEEEFVDTIITDPPYGLNFMGQDWDHGVPDVPFWKTFLRVAKPGAILLAFGGTRTHHRLMCAIEDAGWDIHDCMMWLYGNGFRKSLDISKAIDEELGCEREVAAVRSQSGAKFPLTQVLIDNGGFNDPNRREYSITIPASPEAEEWDGRGTGLKPAWEPIIVAMKPPDGTYAQNALAYGVAGFNIDGGRIPTNGNPRRVNVNTDGDEGLFGMGSRLDAGYTNEGRWPANLLLTHTPDCQLLGTREVKGSRIDKPCPAPEIRGRKWGTIQQNRGPRGYGDENGMEIVEEWECSEDCPVRLLDEQSGDCTSSRVNGNPNNPHHGLRHTPTSYGLADGKETKDYRDSGGASRFFYTGKASRAEKGYGNLHPTVKPLSLVRYLAKLTKTPSGGLVLDPFAGSGTTGLACQAENRPFIMIEQDEDSCQTMLSRLNGSQMVLAI